MKHLLPNSLNITILPLTGNATTLSCGRNSAFPDSDYVSHSPADDGWLLTVHMVSARTKGSACVNSQGKKSRKLSDGATALYYHGDEYSDVAVVRGAIFSLCLHTSFPHTLALSRSRALSRSLALSLLTDTWS